MHFTALSFATFIVCMNLQCKGWPQIGQMANSDNCCLHQFGKFDCKEESEFICAKLEDEYLRNDTMCQFCTTYGNTKAVILHIGKEIKCRELEPGMNIHDDPECRYYSNSRPDCRDEKLQYCAYSTFVDHKIWVVSGDNKCEFCKQYGNMKTLIIYNIGNSTCEPPIDIDGFPMFVI